jgi:hypothetical protein
MLVGGEFGTESVLGKNGGFDMCVVDFVLPDQVFLITCSIDGRVLGIGWLDGCLVPNQGWRRKGGLISCVMDLGCLARLSWLPISFIA